jgi:hypothetical protein
MLEMRVSRSPQCIPRSLMASRVKSTFQIGMTSSSTGSVGRKPFALVELMETWPAAATPIVTVASSDSASWLSMAR